MLIIFSLGITGCEENVNIDKNNNENTRPNTETIAKGDILPDKIYFFYQNTCPHCHTAMEYINNNYENLPLVMINIGDVKGYRLFIQSVKKFELGNQVGTPLIVMNDSYIMGWSDESISLFDEQVKELLNKS